jgi:hypothetical protein
MDIKLLLDEKTKYEEIITSSYKDIDCAHSRLATMFEQMYPTYARLGVLYDITKIDFWLGDVACAYDGKNFELSNQLFSLTNSLKDINVFDLSLRQLKKICALIFEVTNEVFGSSFILTATSDTTIHDVIEWLKDVADYISKQNNIAIAQNIKLGESIQKVYVLIDFALGTDPEGAHRILRSVHSSTLALQSELYDKISIYRAKIDTIDNLIEQSNDAQSTPPPSTSSINTPPRDNVLAQKNNRFFSVKERLTNAFGVLGGVLYFAINIIISILPFVMIGGGFWFSFLLISLNTIVPYASIVFWIWGLICAIQGVQDIWAIIYYILFVVIWLPFYINLILALISDLKNK